GPQGDADHARTALAVLRGLHEGMPSLHAAERGLEQLAHAQELVRVARAGGLPLDLLQGALRAAPGLLDEPTRFAPRLPPLSLERQGGVVRLDGARDREGLSLLRRKARWRLGRGAGRRRRVDHPGA